MTLRSYTSSGILNAIDPLASASNLYLGIVWCLRELNIVNRQGSVAAAMLVDIQFEHAKICEAKAHHTPTLTTISHTDEHSWLDE